jgi:hypothetical protein
MVETSIIQAAIIRDTKGLEQLRSEHLGVLEELKRLPVQEWLKKGLDLLLTK